MPMFQVDAGRSVAVQPLQPARARFGPETSSVVADHLDTLLGEHLLPLRPRQGDEDAPHLLAVDAAGQPVVVEVVALLDQAALLRALRHAGRAARLSTQDLARAYRGGADRFAADLAAFRETVPVTSLLSTTVNGGSRLLLVCSEVADGLEDAIEFLLQPGWQVEVLQVGIIQGPGGKRIVDVSPVTRTAPSRRAMEPTVMHPSRELRTVRSFDAPAPAGSRPQQAPSVAPPAAPVAPPRRVPTVLAPPFAVRLVPSPASQPTNEAGPTRTDPRTDPRPAPRGGTSVVSPLGTPGRNPWLTADLPDHDRPFRLAPVPGTVRPEPAASSQAQPLSQARPLSPDQHVVDHDDVPRGSGSGLPYAFTGVVPPVGARPDARLVRLAGDLGEPVALVWSRKRRGECFEALLHPDGVIELPDGSRHTDPDTAAVAASASASPIDGWRVWRIDSPWGLTLEEACGR